MPVCGRRGKPKTRVFHFPTYRFSSLKPNSERRPGGGRSAPAFRLVRTHLCVPRRDSSRRLTHRENPVHEIQPEEDARFRPAVREGIAQADRGEFFEEDGRPV